MSTDIGISSERAISFDCVGDTLIGIVHAPPAAADLGVVIVVGGPQYRAGSHRQFILLARSIAGAGFAALRFDTRGMGDGGGTARDFRSITEDIGAAINALQAQEPSVRKIVLWGLCDGASAALLYVDAVCDPRVQGLCLVNPWVRSPQSLARAQVRHYYTRRFAQRTFWTKLLSGRVGANAWRGFIDTLNARHGRQRDDDTPYQKRMARAWTRFEGSILLVLSGNDLTAKEFVDTSRNDAEWAGAMRHPRLQRHVLADADHTFSAAAWRGQVDDATVQWLTQLQRSALPVLTEDA